MSHDMPADSVQFGSMHIRIRFGLNAHSIRFPENRVICEKDLRITKLHCYCKHSVLCIGRARAQIG